MSLNLSNAMKGLLAAACTAALTLCSLPAAAEPAEKKDAKAAKDKGQHHDHTDKAPSKDSKDGKAKKDKADKHAKKDKHGHHHHHTAPHGGTLIAVGDHFAHVELVLDKETGRLTAYVLDGEAEKPIRLAQDSLVIEALLGNEGEKTTQTLTLRPTSNVLTGEKVGDTSQFEFGFDALKGVEKFDAVLTGLTIKGKTLDPIPFKFPEGNEH